MKVVFLTLIFLISIGIVPISFATTESCQCVAFRLDDIQDYWLNSVQTKIIDTFQEKNASLTIGIIGNHIGQDLKITNDIKSKLATGNTEIEIANHGWNHEDFTQFSREQQVSLLKESNDKILSLFGITPSVFIPPFNTINNDTIIAFHENNFQYICANVTQDPPSHIIKNSPMYHLPGTAKTGNLNFTYWYSENHKQTFVEILVSLQKYGYAEVVMHPQEYSIRSALNYSNIVDESQISELELLIDEIRNDGLKIVTISEIPKHITNQTIPNWTNHLFNWYVERKITENEVYDAMKFLIKHEVIKFDSDNTKTNYNMQNTNYTLHQNITATVLS